MDDKDRLLLCRFDMPRQRVVVWATPGGGIEVAESPLEALEGELDEEIGLALVDEPPMSGITVVAEGHAEGYDGVINDYHLIKTDNFIPSGFLGAEVLRRSRHWQRRWRPIPSGHHSDPCKRQSSSSRATPRRQRPRPSGMVHTSIPNRG